MIDLLPIECQQSLRREYRRRILVVAAVFFSASLALILILLVGGYVKLRAQVAAARAAVAAEKTILTGRQTAAAGTEAEIKSLNQKMVLIKNLAGTNGAAAAVEAVLAHKTAGLSLKEIVFSTEQNGSRLRLSGVAKTRALFLAFVEALKKETLFKQVDSPISNLVKDKNVNFVINLELK